MDEIKQAERIDLKQVEEQFDVKEIYTPLSIAKKEIRKRWNDKELRKKVEDFLGEIPEIFKKEPSAVLARHVTAPNSEFFHFLELVRLTSLKPVNLEYLKDKYVSCNPAKLYLGKMCFFKKDENHGNGTIDHEYLINFIESENKPLNEVTTLWGENLVDFYHRIIESSKIDIDTFDISKWYKEKGGRAKKYMKYYLALFICNGVLFENYLIQKNEKQFTYNVVLPAFKEIKEQFGLKPLIVPIMPISEKDELYWWAYPESIKKYIPKKN
jgi:hypothetical protein